MSQHSIHNKNKHDIIFIVMRPSLKVLNIEAAIDACRSLKESKDSKDLKQSKQHKDSKESRQLR